MDSSSESKYVFLNIIIYLIISATYNGFTIGETVCRGPDWKWEFQVMYQPFESTLLLGFRK